MSPILIFILGAVVGGVVVWFLRKDRRGGLVNKKQTRECWGVVKFVLTEISLEDMIYTYGKGYYIGARV